MRVLGMISGTSFDGIDYFVGEFSVKDDTISMRRLAGGSIEYSSGLHQRLVAALPPLGTTAEELCIIDTLVGQEFAQVALQAIDEAGGDVDFVASHGQTIYHWVSPEGAALGTLQMGNPAWIAEETGVPVISDIRSRDVAAGGQGAPLASLFDTLVLRDPSLRQGGLNLGGISNITVVTPDHEPFAYDIGPANAMLDAVMVAATNGEKSFDADSELSRKGQVNSEWLKEFLNEPYYEMSHPKSTGKELFNLAYVERVTGPVTSEKAPDILATLTELTCLTVMREVQRWNLDHLYVGGGGTANPLMMERMKALAENTVVETMESLGMSSREKEASFFALIGFMTAYGLPANIPSCTGASGARVLGTITPGSKPLQLPAPHATPVVSLKIIK